MHFFARHRENIRQSSMSSRLLWPCLLLAALLLLTFGAALFLFASLHNTKKDTTRSLEIQYSVFQNDMERYFDQLAVMGVNLSEDMGALVDRQLASREMTFDQLNDSPEVLNALEEEMIEPLCRSLRRTSCSGAFVLLVAAIGSDRFAQSLLAAAEKPLPSSHCTIFALQNNGRVKTVSSASSVGEAASLTAVQYMR